MTDLSQMSDEDLQKLATSDQSAQSLSAPDFSSMSDEDLQKIAASDQNQDLTWGKAGQALIDTVKDIPHDLAAPISHIGQMVYGSDKPNALIGPSMPIAGNTIGETAGNVASLVMPFMAAPPEGMMENSAAEMQAAKPAPINEHVPLKAASDLTDTIFGNLDRANKYYELPKAMAEGQNVQAPEVKDYLQGVISDIQADPFHEARALAPKLQKTLDTLPEDGTVPVSDLLDLRKTSNANFKPGRFSDKQGVYSGLNEAVNSGLDTARAQIPHFSDALDVADGYWKNSVAIPITKNPVLQKVFDMEDAHNIRQFNNGQIDELPDVTKQATNNIINKIKDVDTYNSVRRLLPDDSGQALDAALLKKISPSRWNDVMSAVKNSANFKFGDAVKNFYNVVKPDIGDNTAALIQAIKKQNTYTPIQVKNEAAENAFNVVQGMKSATDKAAAQKAIPPRLAAPYK